MSKITQAEYDEFFSTDSIRRQKELREKIHDAVHEVLNDKFEEKLDSWCFPDAEEGQMGHFEDALDESFGVSVDYWLRPSYKKNHMTVWFKDFIAS